MVYTIKKVITSQLYEWYTYYSTPNALVGYYFFLLQCKRYDVSVVSTVKKSSHTSCHCSYRRFSQFLHRETTEYDKSSRNYS